MTSDIDATSRQASPYILISAHHCAPNMGSEHAVGWNLVSRLSKDHNIILITQDNEYRLDIEQSISKLTQSGHKIKAFFVKHISKTDGRSNNLRLTYYLTYILYQYRVYKLAKTLIKQFPVSIVHHLTIVGFREPGFLWMLGIPFVWGPVGGLVYAPTSLFGELSPKMKVFQHLRNMLTWLQFHLSLRVRLAYQATQKRGGCFIAATPDIGEHFQRYFGGNFIWVPETGSNIHAANHLIKSTTRSPANKLRLLWTGGLIDIKPMGLLLKAIAQVNDHENKIELIVVGDGDSAAHYQALARHLNINASFIGWVDHTKTQTYYQDADLFTLISIKDLTTNVVFEALANGLPVLCLDHHGYSYIIDKTCGTKISIDKTKNICQNIASELEKLSSNPNKLKDLSIGARSMAANFTWDLNASKISKVYHQIN